MNRVISLMLKAALIVTTLAALLFAVRIIVQQVLGIGRWYWGGAFAVFLAPLAFVLAIEIFERGMRAGNRNA